MTNLYCGAYECNKKVVFVHIFHHEFDNFFEKHYCCENHQSFSVEADLVFTVDEYEIWKIHND